MCKKSIHPVPSSTGGIYLISFVLVLGLVGNVNGQIATNPTPADGALHAATWVGLNWSPGVSAVSHDVYFGDNSADVNAGTGEAFRGNQAATNLIVGMPGFLYPAGLVPDTTYYWRIDEVEADGTTTHKGDVWSFSLPPVTAYAPDPADGTRFLNTDATLSWTPGMKAKLHHVYFGENSADVDAGTGGTYKGPVATATYTPGTLANDRTYYWRIDQFDGLATHKGGIWRFRTMPEITITDPNLVGWWKLDRGHGTTALDWSSHNNHGTLFGDPQWAPGYDGDAVHFDGLDDYIAIQNIHYDNASDIAAVTACAWIRTSSSANQVIVAFDRNEYWRLALGEFAGPGGTDGPGLVGWHVYTSSGQVDYGSVTRVDNGLWHHVAGVFDRGRSTIYIDGYPEPSASGGATFGRGRVIRYGFIGLGSEATSFNGAIGPTDYFDGDIDDVRIYDKALTQEAIKLAMRGDLRLAWDPKPTNGSTLNIKDAMPLSWSPGDNAAGHDVYFGTDRATVADADISDASGVYRGRQSAASYSPHEGVEWGGGPYYWRIDEYNTDATVSTGRLWSFTVADFILVDDFEDYDTGDNQIWHAWKDGLGYGSPPPVPPPYSPGNGTGSAVGDDTTASYTEETIVHGGGHAMPYSYDNNKQGYFNYSEATLTLSYPRDWTEQGVSTLTLWFRGDSANTAAPMYVTLNGSATVSHDNPNAALIDTWTQWNIDLTDFSNQGVVLTNVNTISIGFGDRSNPQPGGSGKMYFDDIRLYRPR